MKKFKEYFDDKLNESINVTELLPNDWYKYKDEFHWSRDKGKLSFNKDLSGVIDDFIKKIQKDDWKPIYDKEHPKLKRVVQWISPDGKYEAYASNFDGMIMIIPNKNNRIPD